MISKLQLYRRPFSEALRSVKRFKQYLKYHFTKWPEIVRDGTVASVVDPEK